MTFAEALGTFAVSLRFEDLPETAIASAVECLQDTLGCAVAGSGTEPARAVRATVVPLGAPGSATVVGAGLGRPAALASFANGTAAHALELDDTDAQSFCHAGAVVVPAALAVAEEEGSSGADLVAALVVGYEVTLRLARWVNPEHRLRGFHTTATVPTLGAAAAVARLRGMSAPQVATALGVAGSFTSGTFEFLADGSNIKRVHAGKAAFSAVTSVDLARHGVRGPASVLEGAHGLYATMAGSPVPALDLGDLGSRFLLSEVGRKPYPCCRFCHASIDAAISLHDEAVLRDRTAVVTVRVSRLCAEQTGATAPGTELQRQFSTPYGVALGLLRGRVAMSDFTTDPDPEALDIASRVNVVVDPGLPLGSRVSTVTVEELGEVRSAVVPVPLGEPENPLTADQLASKFLDLATLSMDATRARELFRALEGIGQNPDLRRVTPLLRDVALDGPPG